MNWSALLCIVTATSACGGESVRDSPVVNEDGGAHLGGSPSVDSGSDAHARNGGTGGAPDGALSDAAGDSSIVDPESCEYPVKGIHSCCGGKLCRGQCTAKTGECFCGAIKGGCWAPTACCGSACKSESLSAGGG